MPPTLIILPGRTNDGFHVGHHVAMRHVGTRVVELGLNLDLEPAFIRPCVFDRVELRLGGERTCAMSAAWSSGGGSLPQSSVELSPTPVGLRQIGDLFGIEQGSADVVEKVVSRFFLFARAKIDLSRRPTSRSRPKVKGKKTP